MNLIMGLPLSGIAVKDKYFASSTQSTILHGEWKCFSIASAYWLRYLVFILTFASVKSYRDYRYFWHFVHLLRPGAPYWRWSKVRNRIIRNFCTSSVLHTPCEVIEKLFARYVNKYAIVFDHRYRKTEFYNCTGEDKNGWVFPHRYT